jgi:hypothetical protein
MSKEETEVFRILQKYMKHVQKCEGTTFLYERSVLQSGIEFSPFEINFLRTVEAQITDD